MAYKQHQVMSHFFSGLKEHLNGFFSDEEIPVLEAGEEESLDEAGDAGIRCILSFLGFNEVREHNAMNKIQIIRADGDGNEVEYLVKPPFMFNMEIAAIISGKNVPDRLSCLGGFIGYLKENSVLDPGEYDWAGNNGMSVPFEIGPLGDKQIALIPERYRGLRPFAVAIAMTVGLESSDPSAFTRVRERKFSAIKKDA